MRTSTSQLNQCKYCHKTFSFYPSRSSGEFCSIQHRAKYQGEVVSKQKFEQGIAMDRPIQKRFVIERDEYKCSACFITEWQGKPISLHLDHSDGDPGNNAPSNLRLLCPNCHSQTPSYGGKNKGKGRKSRGLKTY